MTRRPDVVLFGAPGSGKGTQGKLLKKYGYVVMSTGDELRKIVKGKPENENEAAIQETMQAGGFVSDKIIEEIVRNFLKKNEGKSIVWDGFPRTEEQRQAFEKIMTDAGREFEVVRLSVQKKDDPKMIERIINRGNEAEKIGKTVRPDDRDPKIIQNRLNEFREKTRVVIEEWETFRDVHDISAIQEIDEIHEQIVKAVIETKSNVDEVIEN